MEIEEEYTGPIKIDENDRVRILRKDKLSMTMEKFGERIGVQKSAISKIERHENNLSDSLRKLICKEFHVEPLWLMSGEGPIFYETEESLFDEIDRIMAGENEFHKDMIKWVATLDDKDIEYIHKLIKKYIKIKEN